jgi:hypothetical protein
MAAVDAPEFRRRRARHRAADDTRVNDPALRHAAELMLETGVSLA